jgi:hypothetical protein
LLKIKKKKEKTVRQKKMAVRHQKTAVRQKKMAVRQKNTIFLAREKKIAELSDEIKKLPYA